MRIVAIVCGLTTGLLAGCGIDRTGLTADGGSVRDGGGRLDGGRDARVPDGGSTDAPIADATPFPPDGGGDGGASDGGSDGGTDGGSAPNLMAWGLGPSRTFAIWDGRLFGWGDNSYGSLGLGDMADRTSPTAVGTDSDWMMVATGLGHTCAIKSDGTLYCWGDNNLGQLGLGDTTPHREPMRVGGDSDWSRVDADGSFTCAIKIDGSLYCWGGNNFGQLGLGSTGAGPNEPTRVGDSAAWTTVSLGPNFACAIRTDATLWCWGKNDSGQLGLGDTTDVSVPTRQTSGGWQNVALGAVHACGVRAPNRLHCWGAGGAGRLGLGTTDDTGTPTRLPGVVVWEIADVGQLHSCGLDLDGVVYCWGANSFGQLGVGGGPGLTGPEMVSGSYRAIAVGKYHVCAAGTDGQAYCWGANDRGQLGLGSAGPDKTSPVPVPFP